MYSLTNACFNFSCPNLFANCFNDITTSKSINSKKQEELEEWMKKALKNNPGFKTVVQGKAESLQKVFQNKQNLTPLETYMKEVFTYTTGEEMVDINLSRVMSTMHKAVDDKKFGLWCVYRLLGGEAAALNGCDKSSIQIISDSLKNDPELTILKFYSFDISKVL